MQLVVEKSLRKLSVWQDGRMVFACRAALGRCPVGAKKAEGDGRTPEGLYYICLVKENGKYGRSLGLSYPNALDASCALAENRIDQSTHDNIVSAVQERRRPPWGSPLGGEICIHEGGSHADWTQGCIALDEEDMNRLFRLRDAIESVEIKA